MRLEQDLLISLWELTKSNIQSHTTAVKNILSGGHFV